MAPQPPHLPTELITVICGMLEIPQLRVVRWFNRFWNDSAKKYLFKRIYLSCFERDLEYFRNITEGGALSRYTEELVFDDSGFDPNYHDDYEAFRSLTDPHPSCCHFNDETCEVHAQCSTNKNRWWQQAAEDPDQGSAVERQRAIVEHGYRWWSHQARAYFANRAGGEDLKALQHVSHQRWLPKLKRVELTRLPLTPGAGTDLDQPYRPPSRSPTVRMWENELPVECKGLIPWQQLAPSLIWNVLPMPVAKFIEAADREGFLIDYATRDVSYREWRSTEGGQSGGKCYHSVPVMAPYRGLSVLLRVFTEFPGKISEFSVVDSQDHLPCRAQDAMPMAIFLTRGPEMSRLERLASRLTTLRLNVIPAVDQEGSADIAEYPSFKRLLLGAENLEEFYLNANFSSCSTPINDFLGSLHLPKLQRIHLRDMGFTDRELFRFVRRHAATLRELSIFYCRFIPPDGEGVSDAWLWPLVDELRRLGCLRNIDIYVDRMLKHDDMLELAGEPSREQALVQWRAWTHHGSPFPFSTPECPNQDPASVRRVPDSYREYLKS